MPNRDMSNVDDFSETRLWKALDDISKRLTGIEGKLSDVIRLEEKVRNHDSTMARYGNRLDDHEHRIRETEMWKVGRGNNKVIESNISEMKAKLELLELNLNTVKNTSSENKGQKDVAKEILKWASTVFGLVIVWFLTQGNSGD